MKNISEETKDNSCEVKLNFVKLEEKLEDERIKKIARVINRVLDAKPRDEKPKSILFTETLEDVIGI